MVAFLAVVTGQLVLRSIRTLPPQGLSWFGLRSLPILSIGLVAWIVAGLVPTEGLHDVNVHPRPAGRRDDRAAYADARGRLRRLGPTHSRRCSPKSRGRSCRWCWWQSHGGGIRAAYWTTLVLDCVVARARLPESGAEPCTGDSRSEEEILAAARRIFIASGVSGGSVGIAAYAQNLLRNDDPSDRAWMATAFGRDLASATVGWGLFHHLPNHFLGLGSATEPCDGGVVFPDAAGPAAASSRELLDEPAGDGPPLVRGTWDQRDAADAEVRGRAEAVPLLLFNTTVAGGQFGAVTSAAKLGQARVNLEETQACGPTGRPTPTRWPATWRPSISCATTRIYPQHLDRRDAQRAIPSGLAVRAGRGAPPWSWRPQVASRSSSTASATSLEDRCAMTMVDGGYLDNSGLLTLTSLLPEIQRLVDLHNAKPRADIAVVVLDIDSAVPGGDRAAYEPRGVRRDLHPADDADGARCRRAVRPGQDSGAPF